MGRGECPITIVKTLALFVLLAGCVSNGSSSPEVTHAAPTYVCRPEYNLAFEGEPQDLSDLVRRRQERERQAKCKAQEAARELEWVTP